MSGRRAKLLRQAEREHLAEHGHGHKWVALVGFRLSDMEATRGSDPSQAQDFVLLLDADNAIGPKEQDEDYARVTPNIGCVRCEQPFAPELLERRCPGQSPGCLEYVR